MMFQIPRFLRQLRIPLSILIALLISFGLANVSLSQQSLISHPLDPLTAQEIKTAISILKQEKSLDRSIFFPTVALQEPNKQEVLNFKPGDPFERKVFAVVYERSHNKTYEAIVDVKTAKLSSLTEVPDIQPPIVEPDLALADRVVKADPRWQKAMRKRGLMNFEQLETSCWAPGLLSEQEAAAGDRLCRTLTYFRGKGWNFYGKPIEGVVANVSLNQGKVVSFTDSGIIPFSQENWDYDLQSLKSQGKLRQAPKLLKIMQPRGKTFAIAGNEVSWQGWKFRYIMHPRDGLVLYQVTYQDGETIRPVMYRGSLSEMVVPYSDPSSHWAFRNALDVGEYNFGVLSSSMERGRDVPDNAVLLDAVFANPVTGKPDIVPGVVSIYERTKGILWKHYDYVTETTYVRPNRELVVAITGAIDNYDYGINWIFHQDGTIEVQNDLTGLILAQATASEDASMSRPYGPLVAKNIVGVIHQHFFNFRLDLDVDGQANSAMEMNLKSLPKSKTNPMGNAFIAEGSMLDTEANGVRDIDMATSREWIVLSADKKNTLGAPTGYMLMPATNAIFQPSAQANIRDKVGFAQHHLWVTQYKPSELHAAGNYPNQGKSQQGLPEYISDNESLMGQDLVLWYTLGVSHVPRPEDLPVMPVHQVGFKLVPRGFFSRNPAINLPESPSVN